MTTIIIKIFLMNIFPFYRVEFPMNLFPKDFTYAKFDHGKELGKKIINENDETYIALKKLISIEKKGWNYDLTTYAPKNTFNSKKIKINCIDKTIVVNYINSNNDSVQISKKLISNSCPSIPATSLIK
ncbi:MAG: hypothetical protein V4724_14135 [Pseudomonadota bacterium]